MAGSRRKTASLAQRAELIGLLESVTRARGIPFDPPIMLKRYRQKKVMQKGEPGLPPIHYMDFGGKVAARMMAAEIRRI